MLEYFWVYRKKMWGKGGWVPAGPEGQMDHCFGVNHAGVSMAQAVLMLQGGVSVPTRGCFVLRAFRLSQGTSWKEEPTGKFEVRMEAAEVHFHLHTHTHTGI